MKGLTISERKLFGCLLLGGYVLAMGTLAYFPIPAGNREMFSQGFGALGLAVGAIVNSIWRQPAAPPSDQTGQPPRAAGTP